MSSNGNLPDSEVVGTPITFSDFEVSWVGENPSTGRVTFGSDDGRLRTTDPSYGDRDSPVPFAQSCEAVNGVAFAPRMTAVSTRSDVTIFDFSSRIEAPRHLLVHDGGAHGIVATSAGGFVAPLGPEGLLFVNPERELMVSSPTDRPVNLYKLARLTEDGREDVFACAARDGGFMVAKIGSDGPSTAHYFTAPNLDVVDVCSLSTAAWPRAAMALGVDNSFHICRDVLDGKPPKTVHFNSLSGRAYSILSDRRSLFLLTSKGVHIFPGFVESFLFNERIDGRTLCRSMAFHAVDAFLVHEKLLILLADEIISIPIDAISEASSNRGTTSDLAASPLVNILWSSTFAPAWTTMPAVA